MSAKRETRGERRKGDDEELDWCGWGMRAEKLARRRRWKEALACFNKALRLNPCDTVGRDAYVSDLLGKVRCLREVGRPRDAARCEAEARKFHAQLVRGARRDRARKK